MFACLIFYMLQLLEMFIGGVLVQKIPLIILVLGLLLSGCASSSTIPLSKNMVQISTSAAPACGMRGAQKMALRQAAVETINRGFDSFIIVGGQGSSQLVGMTPATTYTTGSATAHGTRNYAQAYGSATSTTYGGMPMYSHGQGLTVRMFKPGEPGSDNAISARQTLGPDWQEIVTKKKLTCL